MAIETRFLNVIIPIRKIIELKGKEWWDSYLKQHSRWLGVVLWSDDYVFRDGSMDEDGIKFIIKFWEKQGLVPKKIVNGQEYWNDICEVDSITGSTLPCEWLEFKKGSVRVKEDLSKKIIGPSWPHEVIYIHQLGAYFKEDAYFLHRQIPYELKLKLDDCKIFSLFKPVIMDVVDEKNQIIKKKMISLPGIEFINKQEISQDYQYQISGEIISREKIKFVFKNKNSIIKEKIYQYKVNDFAELIREMVNDCFEVYKIDNSSLNLENIYPSELYKKFFPVRDEYLRIFEWLRPQEIKKPDVEVVIKKLQSLTKMRKNCGEIYYYLSRIYYSLKDMQKCKESIDEGLKQNIIDARLASFKDNLFVKGEVD